MKPIRNIFVALFLLLTVLPVAALAQRNVLNFTDQEIPRGVIKQIAAGREMVIPGSGSHGKNWGNALEVVKLSGKTDHFGKGYGNPVPDVNVWIAEYPWTRTLDIRTDAAGWWTMYIIKNSCDKLNFSFIYEKEGWITTKTNIITVADEDITDLAIQFIDPDYYYGGMKPLVDSMLKQYGLGEELINAMVVTVGKSWASMHSNRLPHGDPGAVTELSPLVGAVGPIYFNEAVVPDLTRTHTIR